MEFKIIFEIFLKWRKLFYKFFIFSTFLVLLLTFLIPQKYIISTIIMPYKAEPIHSETLPSEYLTLLQLIPISYGVYITPSDILASLSEESGILSPVIEKFGLIETLKAKDMDEALKKFREFYKVNIQKSGMINISLVYKNPLTGTKILNEILKNLENFIKKIHNQFYEKRENLLKERFFLVEKELKAVEDTYKLLKLKYGVHNIEEEFNNIFPKYAELKKEEIEAEIDYKTMLSVIKDTNDIELKRLKKRYLELKKEIEGIENRNKKGGFGAGFGSSLSMVPEISVKLARLWRKIESLSEIYKNLMSELENTKIEASRDIPFFSIVSKPGYSKYKKTPKRSHILLGGIFLSFFFSISLIYILEFFERVKRDQNLSYLREFFETLWKDLKFKK
ncbi:MAG: hypothetical protein ABDH37_00200 [Candidatus Hydrothermales bacterium]